MPPAAHAFGGSWTKTKLAILKGYLKEYTLIFTKNPKAKFFETFYVDAFAGSGSIDTNKKKFGLQQHELFESLDDAESQGFLKGSAACA